MSKLISLSALSSLNADDLFYVSTSLSADGAATPATIASFVASATNLTSLSSNWNSVYNTVSSNSATTWNYQGTDVKALTSNWQASYTALASTSATWQTKRKSLTLASLTTTGTVSCNALSADRFVVTLSGASTSATFATPISAYDAQMIMWNVRYASNISLVSLASGFRTPLTTLNWSLSTNRMDIFAAQYNEPDNKWDVVSFAPGYPL